MIDTDWRVQHQPHLFEAGDVDVWLANLGHLQEPFTEVIETLSAQEQARVNGIIFESDARRFAAGRFYLRVVLGYYTGARPRNIELRHSAAGHLFLRGSPELTINMAQSNGNAVYAISRAGSVGVDIQFTKAVGEPSLIAQALLTPTECLTLKRTAAGQQSTVFYRRWCRKEALRRAIHDDQNLSSFQNLDLFSDAPRLVAHDPKRRLDRWTIFDLPSIEDYTAAVAIEGEVAQVATWQVPG